MTPRVVMVAIPSREVERTCAMRMVIAEMLDAIGHNIGFVAPEFGGAPISAARNNALAIFLKSPADDLFFIDDDVKAEPGAMIRMVQHEVDFVGGVYPHRIDGPSFPLQWHAHGQGFHDAHMITAAGHPLLEVHGVPAGFMRLRRSVVEKMVAAYPDDWYWHGPNKVPDLFDFERRDHLKYSEDFTFCKRWRDIGGKIWIDPEIGFTHTGPKPFYGHLGEWLREREHARAAAEAMAAD